MTATDSAYVNLKLERHGFTAVATVDNPPANTWTAASLTSLKQLMLDLNADGDKAQVRNAARDIARRFGEAFETLSAFRGVSIAAINGYAMGGGLECALACDLRIAEEQAHWRYRKPRWDCCPARAAHRICRGWSAKAGPSA